MRPPVPASARVGRDAYRAIPLYGGGDVEACEFDLSDNTNQWGVPPAAARAFASVPPRSAARYPAAYSPALARACAAYAGVSPDMVVTACGSDQLLDCAMRAFAEPGERVAFADPSFVIVPSFARANSLEPVGFPWRQAGTAEAPDLELDAEALVESRAAITYLCSPNNPTGTVVPPAVIERVATDSRGIVIVDEAYGEFSGWSAVSLLPRTPNLLITRTFSKAFGLAGLRVGYAVGDPALVREIAKARGPYALTAAAEPVAIAALREDMEWVRSRVADAIESRSRLTTALRTLGYRVFPSGANFVLVAPDENRGPGTADIVLALRNAGIAVRSFGSLAGIGNAVRITVGPWPVMTRVLGVLADLGSAG